MLEEEQQLAAEAEQKRLEEEQQKHLLEIEDLKRQIEQENFYLREDLKAEQGFEHIVGQSKSIRGVLKQILAIGRTVFHPPYGLNQFRVQSVDT